MSTRCIVDLPTTISILMILGICDLGVLILRICDLGVYWLFCIAADGWLLYVMEKR